MDVSDGNSVDNDLFNGVTGYVNTDVNADRIVDAADAAFTDYNTFFGIFSNHP